MNSIALQTLIFRQERAIRHVVEKGEPWFVAADVCDILGLENVSLAVHGNEKTGNIGLDDDEYKDDIMIHDTIGRMQATLCVNESGLYHLIFKSRKPEAKQFRRWVTTEVLPSIRKHGCYPPPPPPKIAVTSATQPITPEQERELVLRYVQHIWFRCGHACTATELRGSYVKRLTTEEAAAHLHALAEAGELESFTTARATKYKPVVFRLF